MHLLVLLQVLTTNHQAVFFSLDAGHIFLILLRLCRRLLLGWLLHENGSNLVAALLLKLHLAQSRAAATMDRGTLNHATFNRVRVRLLRSVGLCADKRSWVLLLLLPELLFHVGVGRDWVQSNST